MLFTKENVLKKIRSFRDGCEGEEEDVVIKIQNRILTRLLKWLQNESEKMFFTEKDHLKSSTGGPSGGYEENPLKNGESLLIGDERLISWSTTEGRHGGWDYSLYPAYHNGEKAFMQTRRWWVGEGYSLGNDGWDQWIISFEEGTKLLMEKGAYQHLFQK